ncbi:hypothetical protein PVAG01_01000 [Phlyctema vagabunda]|uniref:Uncharacterized protein n=1 Tax=Phlyctema vagabunda TaxID=108571 RepID=A0ABR4PX82_9HELO
MDALKFSLGGKVEVLQQDLAQKYRLRGPMVKKIWRSLDIIRRYSLLRAAGKGTNILRDRCDRDSGILCGYAPEWNLHDLTVPGSDALLDLLEYRATRSIIDQYHSGVNDSAGDAAFILARVRVDKLQHVPGFANTFMLFLPGQYGMLVQCPDSAAYNQEMITYSAAVDAGSCVSRAIGEWILNRQFQFLLGLNNFLDFTFNMFSAIQMLIGRPRRCEDLLHAALSKFSAIEQSERGALSDLRSIGFDHKKSLDDYLALYYTSSSLIYTVEKWIMSRAGLICDENGRTLLFNPDKYVSIAIFDLVNHAITSITTWDYLCRLMQLLNDAARDNSFKNIILQEVSGVCDAEYKRAQRLFRRQIQTFSDSKYFERISTEDEDDGMARVVVKEVPDSLRREDPQLFYMLHICKAQTNASECVHWIGKLDGHHQSHPAGRARIHLEGWGSLRDLAMIVSFVRALLSCFSSPQIDCEKRQFYTLGSQSLLTQLNPLKMRIDLSYFAVPVVILDKPEMPKAALDALDRFIAKKTGSRMAVLYQDMADECFAKIQQYRQVQKPAPVEVIEKIQVLPLVVATPEDVTSDTTVQHQIQKDTTHLTHPALPAAVLPPEVLAVPEKSAAPKPFKVKASTFEVFSTLFNRSKSRGAIPWTGFEAAMVDLKFSVTPKQGSVFTFSPPADLNLENSFTCHRPHKSYIEGYTLLFLSRRLKRMYGWGEETFEVA